jgi:Cu-Zn family superoxide dismutase
MNRQGTLLLFSFLLNINTVQAAELSVTINSTQTQQPIGTVVFSETLHGLLIRPNLNSLPQGLHGFHLHQHPNCGDHGDKAGSHFDPNQTNTHQGPYGNGHLGDLPVLYVASDGTANTPTLAPRLKLGELKGLTVMVHANGDNYSDTPPLGGGGAREACGVIQ